jgi:4-amino-4-deoxy-L-arabinose transferase-like glycosyltransferase
MKYMTSRLKTILFDKRTAFGVFILLHIFLFNINTAEWGDSYRMLRASEFIRKGAYPDDEKRPPLFPVVLAIRPGAVDPVLWGRGIMFVVSVAFFLVFSSLTELYIKDKRFQLLAKILFIFNPIILYWSLRVMSDVPFALLVLLGFYCFSVWSKKLDPGKAILLGFICGLAVLMRFEGYLLFLSLLCGVALDGLILSGKTIKLHKVFYLIKVNLGSIAMFIITFVLSILPYVILRNPFGSSYFEETSGRAYDLKMLWIYVISVICLFGFLPAVFFITKRFSAFTEFFSKNFPLLVFVALELLLVLLWPAAIPRIFVSVIPILIIPLTLSMRDFFKGAVIKKTFFVIFNLSVLVFFLVSQYYLKLQFLVSQKFWFLGLITLQVLLIGSVFFKKKNAFYGLLTSGLILWALSPIMLHKNNFVSVKKAAEYITSDLNGVIGYNDVSSVSDWYLNYRFPNDGVVGFYYDTDKRENLTFESILSAKIDYLLITNEHNTSMLLDFSKRPYLEEIKDFRYNIGGKVFFAKVIKINKEN